MNKVSNARERKQLQKEKEQLMGILQEAFKIQLLTTDENDILKEILAYAITDNTGRYEERHRQNKHCFYLACGILYNHLSVKQIDYGTPLHQSRYDAIIRDEDAF